MKIQSNHPQQMPKTSFAQDGFLIFFNIFYRIIKYLLYLYIIIKYFKMETINKSETIYSTNYKGFTIEILLNQINGIKTNKIIIDGNSQNSESSSSEDAFTEAKKIIDDNLKKKKKKKISY